MILYYVIFFFDMARLLKLILKSPGAVVLHARHHSHWQSVSKMPWQGADMGL